MPTTTTTIILHPSLLTYNPEKRITAEEALKHPFFNEVPIPVDPSMFPTWPSKSELRMGKVKIGRTPKAPSGGEAFAKMAVSCWKGGEECIELLLG